MAEIKEFTPSIQNRLKPEKPADVTTPEEFKKRSGELEAERQNRNPLRIDEIFELIGDGKITKERLDDFDVGSPDLIRALKWVVDLLQQSKKVEKTVEEQRSAINQLEILLKERDATIDHFKEIIRDLEEKFPPLGGA